MDSVKAKLEELKPILVLAYLSAMGCLCMFSVQSYLGSGLEPRLCLCFMGIIFGVYTFNRFTDTTEDFATDIGRVLFFQRKRIFLFLAIGAMVGSALLLAAEGKLNWMHCLLLGIGFGYSYRSIPWYTPAGGFRLVRIKEMTLVKNLAVSFLWGASVFVLPVLYAGYAGRDPRLLLLLGGGLFLATLNNTLFDDILDADGDRVAGIRTLPTTLGARGSYLLLWSLDLAWIAASGAFWMAGWIDGAHAAFLALLGAYPFLYMGLTLRGRLPKAWIDFVAESDLLLFSIGLALLGLR